MNMVADEGTSPGCLIGVRLIPGGLVSLGKELGQALAQGHQLGVRVVRREGLDKMVDKGLHSRRQRHVQLQTSAGGGIGWSGRGGESRRSAAGRSPLVDEGEPRDIGWVHCVLEHVQESCVGLSLGGSSRLR